MARGITRQLAPASTSTAPSVEFLDARDQEQVDVLKGVIGDGQGKSATARANREELRVGNIELSAIGQVNAKGPKRLCLQIVQDFLGCHATGFSTIVQHPHYPADGESVKPASV